MDKKYSLFIFDTEKMPKGEQSRILQASSCVFWASLPEKAFKNINALIDDIQEKYSK